MAEREMIVLRALGALLGHPRPELHEALPEIVAAIGASALIAPRQRAALVGLVELPAKADPL
jgi:hypothetical protein